MSGLSVIIPSYNSAATIRRTLESVLDQRPEPAAEILVVDSSDDARTQEILAGFEKRGVRVIRLAEKTMPALARNLGAKEAGGPLLVFIDSDAYAAPDWLSRIREAVLRGSHVGGGSVKLPPEQRWSFLALAQYFLQFNEYLDSGAVRQKRFVPSVNLFCEKSLFERIGGFPAIRASEDVLFGFEARKHEKLWFDPSAAVYHVFREDWGSYLRNQRLLGQYILVYRRKLSASPAFRGIIPALLLPAFVLMKFVRITFRVIVTFDAGKIAGYLISLPFLLTGLAWWAAGFFGECFNKRTTDA